MLGSVTSYNSSTGALVAFIASIIGSGTFNSWAVSLSSVGATGATGPIGATGSGGGGATGAGTDAIFFLNGQTVNTSYSIPVGQNSGSFGPITIASGVVVTVPTGGVWTVV